MQLSTEPRDKGKRDMVRWVIFEEHVFNKWVGMCVAYTKRMIKAWLPQWGRFSDLVMLCGGILLALFVSIWPLPINKMLCCIHPQGRRGHWLVWGEWKIICYDLCRHQVSIYLWDIIKTPTKWIYFGRMLFHLSSTVPETN